MTQTLVTPLYPPFEGAEVHAAHLKIQTSAALDLPDVVVHVDDVIQIVVEARVTAVNHSVHTTSGQLVRVQTARALEARLVRHE